MPVVGDSREFLPIAFEFLPIHTSGPLDGRERGILAVCLLSSFCGFRKNQDSRPVRSLNLNQLFRAKDGGSGALERAHLSSAR